jgi:hypothetical protein
VIQTSARDVSALTHAIHTYLHGNARGEDERTLLNHLTDLRLRLSQTQAATLPQTFDPRVRRFRETLEARWGVAGRLADFHRAADQVDTILNNYLMLRTNRRVAFLTLYGFPLVLAASLFSFIFSDLTPGWLVWGIHGNGLIAFIALTVLGIAVIHLLIRDRRPTIAHRDTDNPHAPPEELP